MTKIHETFYREKLEDFEGFKNSVKGEITIILSRKEETYNLIENSIDEEKLKILIKRYLKKYSLRDVVELIYEKNNLSKKKIYDICLKLKNK